MFSPAVAYIVFNRPRHTRITFDAIRAQKPSELFIIADGPRHEHFSDIEKCKEVRTIVEHVDWPCKVHRNYSDVNLGCKNRVVSGLDWVFEEVEEAIIIEDDVLPHSDFYYFCNDLLERYRNDERIMVITGDNFQDGRKRGTKSYYFSKYNHVWGWATWRRAWLKNDPELSFWPTWKTSVNWRNFISDKRERQYWERIFDQMSRNEIDTWDYPWTASVWFNNGLTATPNVNLVTNIGVGPDGTHTVSETNMEGIPSSPLGPLSHPENVFPDDEADRYVFINQIGGPRPSALRRARSLLARVFRKTKGTIFRFKD